MLRHRRTKSGLTVSCTVDPTFAPKHARAESLFSPWLDITEIGQAGDIRCRNMAQIGSAWWCRPQPPAVLIMELTPHGLGVDKGCERPARIPLAQGIGAMYAR